MTKDKWINIRCTEQERQDITEQAREHNMSVASYIRYLVGKEGEGEMSRHSSLEIGLDRKCTLADLYVDPNKHIEKCDECGSEPRWNSLDRHRLYCENCHQIGHDKSTHYWYERNDAIDEWNRMCTRTPQNDEVRE